MILTASEKYDSAKDALSALNDAMELLDECDGIEIGTTIADLMYDVKAYMSGLVLEMQAEEEEEMRYMNLSYERSVI